MLKSVKIDIGSKECLSDPLVAPWVINSQINAALDVGTGFGFWEWHFVTATAAFGNAHTLKVLVCLDTSFTLILA